MKLRLSPILALMLPLVALADSPPRAPMKLQLKPYTLQMRDFNFPSGLRVVFQEDHSQPIVSVSSVIDHGSSDEPPGLEGMAHLIEHLNFRAKHRATDGKELPANMDLVRQLSGGFNATTAPDRTNYLTIGRRENLVPLMNLEALRLRNAIEGVTDEVIKIEREVVRNELRSGLENGGENAIAYLFDRLYPKGHAYNRLTIGTHDSLNAITLKDCQDFVDKYYVPHETTILISGDFDPDQINTYLQSFGVDQLAAKDDPKGERITLTDPPHRVNKPSDEPPAPPVPLETKGEVTGLLRVHGAVQKPRLTLAWSLPGAYRQNDPLMQMVAQQAGIAIQQEMNPDWAYEGYDSSKILSVDCGVWGQKVSSQMFCEMEISDEKDGEKYAEKMLNGLYRMWATDEIYRQFQNYVYSFSKQQYMAFVFQTVDSLNSVFGRGDAVSDFIHQTGDLQYYSRQFEALNRVNADDARKYAEKYMQRARAVGVLAIPYEEGDTDVESKTAQYKGACRDDAASSILTDAELNGENVAKAVSLPDLSKLSEQKLANGMTVVTMPHSSAPIVQVSVRFAGGPSSDGLDRRKLAFASAMWREDSTADPLAIAGFGGWDFRGLWTDLDLTASAGNVLDATFVLRDRIDKLIPYTDGRIQWVKDSKKDILEWMGKPEGWATHTLAERLYPGHPLGAWLTHKDYDEMGKWGANVAGEVFTQVFRPENATIYVVGNVTADEVTKAAQTYFGGWTGYGKKPDGWTPPKTVISKPPPPPERQVLLFNKDNVTQANVRYQCRLDVQNEQQRVTAEVIGDAMDQILWLALREQTGASYGAGAGTSQTPGGTGTLTMGVTTLQNDQIALAIKSFLTAGENAKAGKLDSRMWAVQRFARAQSFGVGHADTAGMLERLFSYPYQGLPISAMKEYPKLLGNATMAEVPKIMDPCVGHEVVTVVGPVSVYQPLLDKAGLKYEVFDWKAKTKEYKLANGLKADDDKDKKKK